MNFNSAGFLVFLPTVVAVYIAIHRRERYRDVFLLAASYFFYMSWNWRYAGLIILSTIIDYGVGRGLTRAQSSSSRRLLLSISVITNLGLLAIFKYYNFFLDVSQQTLTAIGVNVTWTGLNVLLPVGISFYTFQTMSYTIDLYRGQIDHERDFVKFALFVSFFPQLVAGPIVRAKEFLPQLHQQPRIDRREFNGGLVLLFKGLFKKIVIADLLSALAVDRVFEDPSKFSSWDLYVALCGYAFQIYNDFSGYSDIAIGTARMLGFKLPENFNRPYLAEGIREFWSRWHISLSTWLRDYLYIPLGGNRGSEKRTYMNLFATMLLGGLWHGAAINFVLWGLYHGLLLAAAHALSGRRLVPGVWPRRILCFHFVLFGWLLFRVGNMTTFSAYVNGLVDVSLTTRFSLLFYTVLLAAGLLHLSPRNTIESAMRRIAELPAPVLGCSLAALLLLLWGCTLDTPAFIYFQF